ncbi:MAG TPA: class I SAM-dependent methyltransferase [Acetobacteraceae bacterium]
MSNWGNGYVTDITYTTGWYRHQAPSVMALACLLGNVAAPMPAADDAVTYLELGCGQGFGSLLLAASNPSWRVTGIDFNPAHVAIAREWAAAAGITNATFIEADLSTLAESPAVRDIPEADYVSMHGVWSWVPRSVQDGIVRLLDARMRPGGLLHLSYNALPGWGATLGMQRLLRETGRSLAWRSDRRAEQGSTVARDLLAAEAMHLVRSPQARDMLTRIDKFPVAYLAHEFMNESWAPCFMADVAAALGGAKLEWVSSVELIENFPERTLSAAQRTVQQRFEDPLMRELVKDMCLERQLRHDLFVRGARRLTTAQRNEALMDVTICSTLRPGDLPDRIEVPAGMAELNPAFYRPIVQALAAGPRTTRELLALPEIEGRRDNPAELLGIMVGMGFAEPIRRAAAEPGEAAMRFNRINAQRFTGTQQLGRVIGLASYRAGQAITGTVLDLVVLQRVLDGTGSRDDLVRMINPAPEREADLRKTLDSVLDARLPMLRAAGVF